MDEEYRGSPPPCARDIYENGRCICAFHAGAVATEAWVKRVAAESGQRVDWHYVGGHARVLFVGDEKRVRDAVVKLRHAITCDAFRMSEPEPTTPPAPAIDLDAVERRYAIDAIDRPFIRVDEARALISELRAHRARAERLRPLVEEHAALLKVREEHQLRKRDFECRMADEELERIERKIGEAYTSSLASEPTL